MHTLLTANPPYDSGVRAIATRYGKTARNLLAGVRLASSVIWLK